MDLTLEELQSKCSAETLAARDYAVIAAQVSIGRSKPDLTVEIGNGTILETIGLTAGTALLDAIHATPSMKYVLPILDQGRLKVGSTLVQGAVDNFVGATVITPEHGAALKALGFTPDPVTAQQISDVMGKI